MSSQAAVVANREKRTPAGADAASEPPWSVGAAEGEAVGAAETVGAQVSAVTPHEVASQPAPVTASSRSAVMPHQPRSWVSEEAKENMYGISSAASMFNSPMGLRTNSSPPGVEQSDLPSTTARRPRPRSSPTRGPLSFRGAFPCGRPMLHYVQPPRRRRSG